MSTIKKSFFISLVVSWMILPVSVFFFDFLWRNGWLDLIGIYSDKSFLDVFSIQLNSGFTLEIIGIIIYGLIYYNYNKLCKEGITYIHNTIKALYKIVIILWLFVVISASMNIQYPDYPALFLPFLLIFTNFFMTFTFVFHLLIKKSNLTKEHI